MIHMQVIVQDQDKRIWLMCKGADSKIFERLHPDSHQLMQTTLNHLAVCFIPYIPTVYILPHQDYAHEGLRTLCLAQKEISEGEYSAWEQKHHEAR